MQKITNKSLERASLRGVCTSLPYVLMSSWKLSAYVIWTTVIVRADDAKSQDILLNANNYFADPVSLQEVRGSEIFHASIEILPSWHIYIVNILLLCVAFHSSVSSRLSMRTFKARSYCDSSEKGSRSRVGCACIAEASRVRAHIPKSRIWQRTNVATPHSNDFS